MMRQRAVTEESGIASPFCPVYGPIRSHREDRVARATRANLTT